MGESESNKHVILLKTSFSLIPQGGSRTKIRQHSLSYLKARSSAEVYSESKVASICGRREWQGSQESAAVSNQPL